MAFLEVLLLLLWLAWAILRLRLQILTKNHKSIVLLAVQVLFLTVVLICLALRLLVYFVALILFSVNGTGRYLVRLVFDSPVRFLCYVGMSCLALRLITAFCGPICVAHSRYLGANSLRESVHPFL